MTLPVYSHSFGIWKDQTTADLGLVEPGTLWVIRDIEVYNGNTLTAALAWFLETDLVNAQLARHDWLIGDAGAWTWRGRLVVPYGDGLRWFAVGLIGSSGCDVSISGYVLGTP